MAFVAVFGPIYERYQESLAGSEEIDFHDMINRATELVESGRFRSPFKYILVDEFQDISPSRAALLELPGVSLHAKNTRPAFRVKAANNPGRRCGGRLPWC